MHSIWAVTYKNGRTLHQYDTSAPEFVPIDGAEYGGEVPYRSIDWPEADYLTFYSDEHEVHLKLDIPDPTEYRVSLRQRTFMNFNDALACFILLVSKANEPVDDASVVSSFYWFPDGTSHSCTKFDCPDVRQWATGKVHRADASRETLVAIHETLQATADAVLE